MLPREPVAKAIEERVEIIVRDHEDSLLRMRPVVLGQMAGNLQADGRLSSTFFTKNDRRRGFGRIAVHFVPSRMVRAGDAMVFENRVGLGILFGKRIGADAMVFKELLNFHGLAAFSAARLERIQ